MPDRGPSTVPSILQPLATDEYDAPPRTPLQQRAVETAATANAESARRLAIPVGRYVESRRGTASGLLAMNESVGGTRYFEVPPEAALDDAAATAAFPSDGPVIDVQTHWIANRPTLKDFERIVLGHYRGMAPDWWSGLDDVTAFSIAEYLRCVFVEAETALAVISAAPGNANGEMFLKNHEMAGMRELFDRTAGTGRLLNHTVVRPNLGEIERMPEWAATFRPVGWKVYTLGLMDEGYQHYEPGYGWRLDDQETGMPFLEQARAVGVKLVCAHKGVSGMVDAGSPERCRSGGEGVPGHRLRRLPLWLRAGTAGGSAHARDRASRREPVDPERARCRSRAGFERVRGVGNDLVHAAQPSRGCRARARQAAPAPRRGQHHLGH